MLNISKKSISWCEGRASETFLKLWINNYSYDNQIYKINCTCMCADPYILMAENEDFPEEYLTILNEIFGDQILVNMRDCIPILPVLTANISFEVHEDDIIKSDTLYFKTNKLKKFNLNVIAVDLYEPDGSTCDIDTLLNTENKISLLLNHPKGKEIYNYLKNEEETFWSLTPGYGVEKFPTETDNGFIYS